MNSIMRSEEAVLKKQKKLPMKHMKIWSLILENYPHDAKRQMNFFENAVHTEKMEKDMISEFLKDMQYYWTSKGVRMTDPSLAGL